MTGNRRALTWTVSLLVVLAAATGGTGAYRAWRLRTSLPYNDRFAAQSMEGWTSYGGNWQVSNGGVTNTSNESGSRLLTGREDWTNYQIDSDVRLTNGYGDAGIVFRVTQSEVGTNAFYGYYAAVRLPDLMVLARMDYGFQPLRVIKLPQAVEPGSWYHLRITAVGCTITAQARTAKGRLLADTQVYDSAECQHHGSVGLRSFAAGGSWRNVRVQAIR